MSTMHRCITMNEYHMHALRTMPQQDSPTQLDNAVFGLVGEVGEVVDHIKKHKFQQHALQPAKIAEELGDILWYIAQMCSAIGYNLDDVASGNVHKLQRRYPEGFEAARSIKRNYDEVL